MFTQNEELNKIIKKESNLKEEDLIEAIEAIIEIKKNIPNMLKIDSMQTVNSDAIKKEVEDRKDDIKEVKDNYIKRFDKVDGVLEIIFKKIDSTDKWTKRLLVTILVASVLSNIITKLF